MVSPTRRKDATVRLSMVTRAQPRTRANDGKAGSTYVGSLHDDSVKNSTHQPPASRWKPSSGERVAADCFADSSRHSGTSSIDPGHSASSSTGT